MALIFNSGLTRPCLPYKLDFSKLDTEGIDVLLNEFQNNVNIMGTGIPMMGRKLLRHGNPGWGRNEGNIFTLHFKTVLAEIMEYVLIKQYQ